MDDLDSKEYPWWADREVIKKFLENQSDWYLALPDDLVADDLRELYEKHCPREFVAWSVVFNVLDHPHCPKDVLEDGLKFFKDLCEEANSILAGLATRAEFSAQDLEQLAKRYYGDGEIDEHALGTLRWKANKNEPDALDSLRRVEEFRRQAADSLIWSWNQPGGDLSERTTGEVAGPECQGNGYSTDRDTTSGNDGA